MSDYISREAAIEAIREEFGCETCNGGNIGTMCTFCDVGQTILLIKNIPAADVEPVRHGAWHQCFEDWRQQQEGNKCSVCGFEYYGTGIRAFHYCPNCCAKMILEDENHDDDRAIEILNPEPWENYGGLDEVNEACRMGMEALGRTRWIPCSDRLPETDGPYLVANKATGWIGAYNFAREQDFPSLTVKENVWWRMGDDLYPKMLCGVTHWMPLPEPPEEGGTENAAD